MHSTSITFSYNVYSHLLLLILLINNFKFSKGLKNVQLNPFGKSYKAD